MQVFSSNSWICLKCQRNFHENSLHFVALLLCCPQLLPLCLLCLLTGVSLIDGFGGEEESVLLGCSHDWRGLWVGSNNNEQHVGEARRNKQQQKKQKRWAACEEDKWMETPQTVCGNKETTHKTNRNALNHTAGDTPTHFSREGICSSLQCDHFHGRSSNMARGRRRNRNQRRRVVFFLVHVSDRISKMTKSKESNE